MKPYLPNCVDAYLRTVDRLPGGLTRAQEAQATPDQLVEGNLRFVVSIARQYQNCGLPIEDVIAAGNHGLCVAAHRFDATRGWKFISYAVWWIRQSIMLEIADTSRLVRLPLNRPRARPRRSAGRHGRGPPGRPRRVGAVPPRPGALRPPGGVRAQWLPPPDAAVRGTHPGHHPGAGAADPGERFSGHSGRNRRLGGRRVKTAGTGFRNGERPRGYPDTC